MERPRRAAPVVIRSKLVLEVASELVGLPDFAPRQARLQLRPQGAANPWELGFIGSDAPSVFDDVAAGTTDLGIINPSDLLTVAYRGAGPFTTPLPVRTIAVIPSRDAFLFAIHERTGITSLEQIRERHYPLKISIRAQSDHSVYLYTNEVFRALGFSLDDVVSWGGSIVPHNFPPPSAAAIENGEVDAIFDEAINGWSRFALDHGMRFIPLDEPLLQRLEAMGFRRAYVTDTQYPQLPAGTNVPTLDFSGFPVFTLASTPDLTVRQICAALEARKDRIPWQGEGPLPLAEMCRNTPEAPINVPFHPAAEQFWRDQGYIA